MRKPGQRHPGVDRPVSGFAAEKRLERLRKMLDEGTYRVRAEKVADKIVEDAVHAARSRDRSQ